MAFTAIGWKERPSHSTRSSISHSMHHRACARLEPTRPSSALANPPSRARHPVIDSERVNNQDSSFHPRRQTQDTSTSGQACQPEAIRKIENIRICLNIRTTSLDQTSRDALNTIAAQYQGCPVGAIDVVGYTDSLGPPAKNIELSVLRARQVAAYLVRQGIPSNKLQVMGRGAADPLASNTTVTGRWNNRRVELQVRRHQ